ncbi:MAG: ABC transporter substrate-binding protein [Bacteroidaceae bacterium]|nr:ABC transporter substrate-binding protein [Bacteroidaceae bacterium]
MKRIILWLLAIGLLSACHSSPTLSPEEVARRDSAALHVALLPVADCFPFYIAQRSGIYERLGLDLRILTLQAQLDTDTALLHGRAELVYSDLVRAIMIQQTDTFDLRAIASAPAELDLITARRGRVRSLNQLKERMVAVARHSITDYWSDRLMDSARMTQTDIFRPQINDVRIRTDMICNGTMDAAFLPEPFAHEALLRGNTRNFSTRGLQPQLGAYLVPTWVLGDSTRTRQLRLLFQGYEEARTLRDSIPSLLRDLCLTPDSIVDSIARALPAFQPLERPSKEQADAALRWLSTREKAGQKYTTDTLIVDFYGLKSIQ